MFIPSDPWTALAGNNVHQYSQPKSQFPFYHGLLGGIAVCDNHLVGLKSWYWAQAVAFWKAQQNMAQDNWMSVSEAGEDPCFKPDDQPVPTQDPFWVPHSVTPFLNNGFYTGQVPHAVDSLPLPFQCDPTAMYATQDGLASSDMTQGFWPDIYVSPSPESDSALTGAGYVMELDGRPDMKREPSSPMSFTSFHSAEEWMSPGCPKYKTSLSPVVGEIPPQPAPYAASPPDPRNKAQRNKKKDRKPLPTSWRQTRQRKLKARTRSPTPEPKACKKPAPLPCLPRGADRAARDEFLVKAKRAGRTYKEIRALGGFAEAESTLRGRFRTLTKRVEERLRKPVWADIDIHLLREAVRKLSKGQPPAVAKISWSEVSEYIVRNGGTYRFGNATCAKKWDELDRAQGY